MNKQSTTLLLQTHGGMLIRICRASGLFSVVSLISRHTLPESAHSSLSLLTTSAEHRVCQYADSNELQIS